MIFTDNVELYLSLVVSENSQGNEILPTPTEESQEMANLKDYHALDYSQGKTHSTPLYPAS